MFRQVIRKEYVQSRDSWEHMSTYMIPSNIVIANINGRYRRSTDLYANCQAPVACAKLAPTDVMRLSGLSKRKYLWYVVLALSSIQWCRTTYLNGLSQFAATLVPVAVTNDVPDAVGRHQCLNRSHKVVLRTASYDNLCGILLR